MSSEGLLKKSDLVNQVPGLSTLNRTTITTIITTITISTTITSRQALKAAVRLREAAAKRSAAAAVRRLQREADVSSRKNYLKKN